MRLAAQVELWSQGETTTGSDAQKKDKGMGGCSGVQEPKKKAYVQIAESTAAMVEQGKGKNAGQRQGSGNSVANAVGQKPLCFFFHKPNHMWDCPKWREAQATLQKKE